MKYEATGAKSFIPPAEAILSVQAIGRSWALRDGGTKEAIREISFEVAEREFVSIVGPSGAGKTTLLRCIAGLLEPSRGTVLFEGSPIHDTPIGIAVVFQDYSRSLFPWLTVASNVMQPLRAKGTPRRDRAALVRDALEAVGLKDAGNQYPWQLSGGMQQRVAIARAIAYQPRVLLMDEPFASVDAQTRFELEDLVLRVRDSFGMTIVFVTHDIDESVYLSDRVVVLSRSPCLVQRDVSVELGARDQVKTRADPLFATLRTEIFELIIGSGSDGDETLELDAGRDDKAASTRANHRGK